MTPDPHADQFTRNTLSMLSEKTWECEELKRQLERVKKIAGFKFSANMPRRIYMIRKELGLPVKRGRRVSSQPSSHAP